MRMRGTEMATTARLIALLVAVLLAAPLPAAAQGVVVRGVVRESSARPIALAELIVNDSVLARSDTMGRFNLVGLAPGAVELTVRRVGFMPLSIPLTLVPGQNRNLAIELAPLPYALEPVIVSAARPGIFGQVVNESGAPIADAEVHVFGAGQPARTGEDGSFAVLGLTDRNYLVLVRRDGHYAAHFSVTLPPGRGQEVRVELEALPGELTGSARRIASGFSVRDMGRLRDLDRRMGVNLPFMVPRAVLAAGGKRRIVDVLLRDRLQAPAHGERGLTSIDPEGTASVPLPPGPPPLADLRPTDGTCYFIDGDFALDQSMARTTPATWLESVEISRHDHTGTLRSRLPSWIDPSDCRLWVVLWMRR